MLKKKLQLLFLLVVLLVSVTTSVTTPASACGGTCSGDDCGCYIYAEWCRADCHSGPSEYLMDCLAVCRRESVACAKACCAC